MSANSRLEKIYSDRGLIIKRSFGETLALVANSDDTLTLKSLANSEDDSLLGSITITGMTAKKAAKKKKGFWGKLWDKVKKVAGDALDAVTVPVFGYRCRPDANISFNPPSFTLGIKCVEA